MPEDYQIGQDELGLDLYEMQMAGLAGLRRHGVVVQRRPNWYFGAGQTELTPNQRYEIGAIGEYALSIMLNLCWRPYVGTPNMPDVGGLIECRTVRYPEGKLNVKPSDPIGVPFVLVTWYTPNIFKARGWLDSKWMRENCFQYPDGDRCWTSDNYLLWKMIDLRRWIHARSERTIAVGNRNTGALQC
jgi:hypothetical protein